MCWHLGTSSCYLKAHRYQSGGLPFHVVYDPGACFAITEGKEVPEVYISWAISFNTQRLPSGRWAAHAQSVWIWCRILVLQNEARAGEKLKLVSFIRSTLARQSSGKIMLSFLLQTLFFSFDLQSSYVPTVFMKHSSLFQGQKCFCGFQPKNTCVNSLLIGSPPCRISPQASYRLLGSSLISGNLMWLHPFPGQVVCAAQNGSDQSG